MLLLAYPESYFPYMCFQILIDLPDVPGCSSAHILRADSCFFVSILTFLFPLEVIVSDVQIKITSYYCLGE